MDLGAVLCRPAAPQLRACPLQRSMRVARRRRRSGGRFGRRQQRQARFEGSDRQARGRLMKALADGPVPVDRVAAVMGCDDATAERLVDDLQREASGRADAASTLHVPC